jgi:hypothetical protein
MESHSSSVITKLAFFDSISVSKYSSFGMSPSPVSSATEAGMASDNEVSLRKKNDLF